MYDLIESFRWLLDYSVFQIANHKDTRKQIKLKEFAHTREGKVVLEYDLVRRFLELLGRNFQRKRKYFFPHDAKTKARLKTVQEIIIVKVLVMKLAKFCIGNEKEYTI